MLHKFCFTGTQTSGQRVNASWGSLMHGLLHQQLPEKVADKLHQEGLRPYAQYICRSREENGLEWHVQIWDDEIADAVRQTFQCDVPYRLLQKQADCTFSSIDCQSIGEEAWALPFFMQEIPCRVFTLRFLTPCTHKSEGQYVLFPTTALIINSLYRRFSQFSTVLSVDDPQAMHDLSDHIQICGYQLRDAPFDLEGIRIRGYVGSLTLMVQGSAQLQKLAGMLLHFAEYAGVGIKTGIGMGGCEVTNGYRSNKKELHQDTSIERNTV